MVFKTAFFAALCVAQVFAYVPKPSAFAKDVSCKDPFDPFGFKDAVAELDKVRDTVSLTALDAYTRKIDPKVIIACLRAQKDQFIQLREKFVTDIRTASEELAKELNEKAKEYVKQMEVPMNKIYVTLKDLPETVYNYLQQGQFLKAAAAIEEARKVVEENSQILFEIGRKVAAEVPDMVEKVEKMAEKIRNDARKSAEEITEAFLKCVEHGGPA